VGSFKVSFPGNKKVDVEFDNFKIKTDQSVKNGGDETALEPFAVFLSSLAACAGIYAKSYCDTRNLSTENETFARLPRFSCAESAPSVISFSFL